MGKKRKAISNPNDNLDQVNIESSNLNESINLDSLVAPVGTQVQQKLPQEIKIPEVNNRDVVNKTISSIKRDPSKSRVSEAIDRAFLRGNEANSQTKDPSIIQTSTSELSPGLRDPILKGTVSGSLIGNQPIFVGGGDFAATSVLNNRRKAVQDAALKREQDASAIALQQAPLVKDKRFQGSLNKQFEATKEGYIKEAQRLYGKDWDIALKDQSTELGRAFVRDTSNYNFIAGQADQVSGLIGQIDADLKSGGSVFSDETLQLRDDYNQLQGSFLNGDISGLADLSGQFDKLKGFANLDKIIDDQNINIKGTVTQTANRINTDDSIGTTTRKKVQYEDQLKVIAKGLARNQMRDAVLKGNISEQEIFDRLNARYGFHDIVTKTIRSKSGRGSKINIDLGQSQEGEKTENIGGVNYTVVNSFELPTGNKEIEVSGLSYYDPETGNLVQEDGIKNIDINSFQVVKVKNPETGEFELKKVAAATTTEQKQVIKNNKVSTQDVSVTKLYDLENLGPRVKTDLIKNSGDFDEMIKIMDGSIDQGNKNTNIESALEFLK